MSTTSYIRKENIRYVVAWSIIKNGKRKWVKRIAFCNTPDAALEETRKSILLSKRSDFEMRLVGILFE